MIFSRRVVLGCSFLLLGVSGCNSRAPQDMVRDQAKKVVEQNKDALQDFGTITTKNSKLIGNDAKGRPLWMLQFQVGQIHNGKTDENGKAIEPRHGDLNNASAALYREGQPETTFRASKIVFTDTPKGLVMTMSGAVQAHTAASKAKAGAPVDLKTEHVQVDVNTRQLHTDSPVTMTQGQTVVTAQKLAADTALTLARVSGGIVANSPQGRIVAQNAVWSWGKGRAQATGNVVVSRDQTRLTGQTLDADANGARGSLSGAGGVSATSPQGQARAQRVLYDWRAGAVSVVGDVSMQKDGATLRAAQIDSDDKLNHAQARGSVVLTRGDATVTAERLEAFDRMTRVVASRGATMKRPNETLRANDATIWLDEKRAVASGGVTLTRNDGTLTADRAQYWSDSGRATASGNVLIHRQNATLKADSADYWSKDGRAVGNGDVTLVRNDVTIVANHVEAANISNAAQTRIVATGDVRARTKDGTMRGQRVTWNGKNAVATGGVSLQKSGNVLNGQRLETDAKFGTALLSGGVSGSLVNGSTFSANQMRWNRVLDNRVLPNNGRIAARGGVVLRKQGVVLRGANLDASGDGKNVLLSGGVVATEQDGARVEAQTARYDAARATIVANGDVSYRDAAGNRLRGSDLVAHIAGNTFKNATMNNVQGKGTSQILSGKTLFGG